MKILVTGGAGFIGSHLVDALIERGHSVRVFDSLEPQVHGEQGKVPEYLSDKAEFQKGDVRNLDDLRKAMRGVEAVYFLAAAVGVGQSMYEIRRYTEINTLGAANFLELLVNEPHSIQKLVVASSMSIYGEGAYQGQNGKQYYPTLRTLEQLKERCWEHLDEEGIPLEPLPTPETKPLYPTSVYAVNKRDHEELFLAVGAGYGIPVAALRYFNVYGPRQALSNPYTGVAAIFSSQILNGIAPKIFEDGMQTRDFIHVSDIVQANLLALEKSEADGQVFNVGTGTAVTIRQIADHLSAHLGFDMPAEVTDRYRVGDIRHCFADISKARELLGYQPKVGIDEGMAELVAWVREQAAESKVESSMAELNERKLIW